MSKQKILIVDDTEDIRDLLSMALEDCYQISTVNNGVECLDAIMKDPPDLILLDVLMPHMGGDDVCFTLKSSPGLKDIPIIIMSALDILSYETTHGISKADAYIRKPLDIPFLLSKIRDLIATN